MPAGDLLDDDFQIEVNGLLHDGSDTASNADYELTVWPSFFQKLTKVPTVDLIGDGDYVGRVFLQANDFAWTVEIVNLTPATLQTKLDALLDSWNGYSTELHFKIAGTHYMVEGHPLDAVPDESTRQYGLVAVALEFHAQPGVTVVT